MSLVLEQIAKKTNSSGLNNNHIKQQNFGRGEQQFYPSPLKMSQSQLQAKKEWHQQHGYDLTQIIQKQAMPEEEELLQTKTATSQETVQTQAMSEEEELLQTKTATQPETVQTQAMSEEEELLQTKTATSQERSLLSKVTNREKLQAQREWQQQYGFDLTRTGIQPKLTLGQPGDKYEQEADKVAASVVEKINQPTQTESVQQQPILEEDEEPIQMRSTSTQESNNGEISSEFESSLQQARSGGEGLPSSTLKSMEGAFGADFSGVRVHNDSQADSLNRSIQARAFTTGQDIFFRQGEYNPVSKQGQELLAHELTHVVQQGGDKIQRQEDNFQNQEKQSKLTIKDIEKANPMIFPIKYSYFKDAPLRVKKLPNGHIAPEYPVRVGSYFAEDIENLRKHDRGEPLLGSIQLDPEELVGVKDYNDEGRIRYTSASDLIEESKKTEEATFQQMEGVVEIALPVLMAGGFKKAATLIKNVLKMGKMIF